MGTPNPYGGLENPFFQDPRTSDTQYHKNSDVDAALTAKHHTLGQRRHQASPGNHVHTGTDGSLFLPTIIKGATTASTHSYGSASATLVSITEAVLSDVSLVAGRVYIYDFHVQVSYSADTSAAGARATFELRKTNTAGTLLGTMQYQRDSSLTNNDSLIGRFAWVADTTETIPLSLSFARANGGATFTVQTGAGFFYAFVSELAPSSKWTVTA